MAAQSLQSPYESAWANFILREQFKISMKKVPRKSGTRWVVKRVKEDAEVPYEDELLNKFLKSSENKKYQEPIKIDDYINNQSILQ